MLGCPSLSILRPDLGFEPQSIVQWLNEPPRFGKQKQLTIIGSEFQDYGPVREMVETLVSEHNQQSTQKVSKENELWISKMA